MNYIALTIGPIYKTLQNAKKPKELFASSYIFSYIMREIIENFQEREFVIPYIEDRTIFDKESKIGLFHDRFIFQSKENDLEKLHIVIENVLHQVSQELEIDVTSLQEYLQIHYTEKELDTDANPITTLTPYLDTQELFFRVSQDNSVIEKLRRKKGDKDNFLTKNKDIKDDLEKLSYHNYYCVVHADGDSMGKVIEDKNNIQKVSQNLFRYCKNSYTLIQNFGGQTIFAGGDDLLFIAPVVGEDKTTIFQLCDAISKDFDQLLSPATLSFGITINYIKFPLYEALENSREQLFVKAKNELRNNISFKVTKHSGQSFEALVHKGDEAVYNNFLAFVSSITDEQDNTNFLHSIHHKIDSYKTTINLIGKDTKRVQNFFDNYFNETSHDAYREFFRTLVEFISSVYQSEKINNKLDLIYATLRFIKFVKGDKK